MKKIIFPIFLFVFSGCVYGPEVERKTPLNALNGENYSTAPDMRSDSLVVPFAKKKERITIVRGKLVLHEGMAFPIPLKFLSISLLNAKGDFLQKVTTQVNGDFVFSGIFPNGSYQLKLESEKYSAQLNFEIKEYLVEKLILQASRSVANDDKK